MAAPTPEAPPVTTATLLANRAAVSSWVATGGLWQIERAEPGRPESLRRGGGNIGFLSMAVSSWRAQLVTLIAALVGVPLAASAATDQPPAQAPTAQTSSAEQPIVSLTLEVSARELRFDSGPDLSVSVGNGADKSVLVDTCQFAPGVTYQDVHVRLEVSDTTATLRCDPANAETEPRAAAEDGEAPPPELQVGS